MNNSAGSSWQDEDKRHLTFAHEMALLEGTALLELAFKPSSSAAREVLAMVARVLNATNKASEAGCNGA